MERHEEIIARSSLARQTQLTYSNDIIARNLHTDEEVQLNELHPNSIYRLEFKNAIYRTPITGVQPCVEGSCLIYGSQMQRIGNLGIVCDLPEFTVTNINCFEDYDKIIQAEGFEVDFPTNSNLVFGERLYKLSRNPNLQFQNNDDLKKEEKSAKKDKRAQMFYVNKDAKMSLVQKYIDMPDVTVACRGSDVIKDMFWTVDAGGRPQQLDVNKLEPGDYVLFGSPTSAYGTPDLVEDVVSDIMIDEKHRIYLIELESGMVLSSIDFEKELLEVINQLELEEEQEISENTLEIK